MSAFGLSHSFVRTGSDGARVWKLILMLNSKSNIKSHNPLEILKDFLQRNHLTWTPLLQQIKKDQEHVGVHTCLEPVKSNPSPP